MARITVEDCVDKIPNRYELVLVASNRARSIALGATPTVAPAGDKPTVIALREIAAGTVSAEHLREALIHSLQYNVEVDAPDASAAALPAGQVSDGAGKTAEERLFEAMQNSLPPDPSIPETERASEREPVEREKEQ